MKNELQEIAGWTLIRDKRDMSRFNKKEFISYEKLPKAFPCFARSELNSDENPETRILEMKDVTAMSRALLIIQANFDIKRALNIK